MWGLKYPRVGMWRLRGKSGTRVPLRKSGGWFITKSLRLRYLPRCVRAGLGREAHIGGKEKKLGRERMRLRGLTA